MTNESYFTFLDNLRESGETNMFGAAPYLCEVFGISKAEARAILADWMKTFEARHPSARRREGGAAE